MKLSFDEDSYRYLGSLYIRTDDEKPQTVAELDPNDDFDPAEMVRLGRKMAASEELFNALLEMCKAFGNCGSPFQQAAADAAQKAIKKAEGKL